ncbi:flagellar basal-body rod modification protein FlgD [uncultured Gammaproteobacteria bacterium]
MSAITATSATTTANGLSTSTSTGSALKSLDQNFDQFLRLLTTQMQNQDPLKPMDNNEMTQQLVSFANVEQNISTNTKLDKLISLQQGSMTGNNLSYLGRMVEATGDKIALVSGVADLFYNVPTVGTGARIDILDSSNNVIRSISGADATAGEHRVVWDGKNDAGTSVSDGSYRLNVAITSADPNKPIIAETRSSGYVTGVDMTDGSTVLSLGKIRIKVEDVLGVRT